MGAMQSDRLKLDSLGALTAETTGELEVLGLDGDALGVDGGQVGCHVSF
jgi:hypothetical protein